VDAIPEIETPAVDIVLAAFMALSVAEQEVALRSCQSSWLQLTDLGSEGEQIIKSLVRASEIAGSAPGIEEYKAIRNQQGEDLVPASRILKHFGGSWHRAKEAIDLTQVNSVRRIEERFAKRQLGKIWKYTDQTLRESLLQAADEIGHAPQVAEYSWWRERQLEIARTRGEEVHLPSPTPYRKRFGSWEAALKHYGFSAEEIDARLERR
jgi:hypothetical protein